MRSLVSGLARLVAALCAFALLSSGAAAQVSPGYSARHAVAGLAAPPTPPGIERIDIASGAATRVLGLSTGVGVIEGLTIDPITGELFVGLGAQGPLGPPYEGDVYSIKLSGSTVIGQTLFAAGSGAGSIVSVELSPNGDVFAVEQGWVFQRERGSGSLLGLDGAIYYAGAQYTDAAVDADRNVLWLLTWEPTHFSPPRSATLIRYDLSTGRRAGGGVELIDFAALGFESNTSGLAIGAGGAIYVSTLDAGAPLLRFDPLTSVVTRVTGAPPIPIVDVEWDRARAVLHLVGADIASTDEYHLFDPATGTFSKVPVSSDLGLSQGAHVNDWRDRAAVYPRWPTAGQAVRFEIAAHGNTLDVAGLAVVSFNGAPISPLYLGAAVCDGAGIAALTEVAVPAGSFSAGNTLGVLSVRLDAVTGAYVTGTTETVTFLP